MIRTIRAEWCKLTRKGMILGGAGTIVAVSLLVVALIFISAQAPQPPSSGQQGPNRGLSTLDQLSEPGGMVAAFSFAGQLISVVSLVLFAQGMGMEYAQGTLKVQLSREPRRLVLLGGKTVATAGFVLAAIVVAFVLQSLLAFAIAATRGVDTGAWWGASGLTASGAALGRVLVAATIWGLMGTLLGIVFRSAAPAIGVGIGYTLVGESIVTLVWAGGRKILPGQVLSAFTQGGNAEVSLVAAALILTGYALAFAVASGVVFWRRDVAT
jgi:ABC-2 type transport system permease protein